MIQADAHRELVWGAQAIALRRIQPERRKERFKAHRRRFIHGKVHDAKLCRIPVLYHAQGCAHLDGAYAAFGKVTEGMNIVDKIANERTDYSDRPLKEQKIKSMTVDTFGVDYPEPEKC